MSEACDFEMSCQSVHDCACYKTEEMKSVRLLLPFRSKWQVVNITQLILQTP